jgi:hypothetical protein
LPEGAQEGAAHANGVADIEPPGDEVRSLLIECATAETTITHAEKEE